jgi:dTDP-4-amino-4,6-dideoxygalactose transaminase
VIYDAAHAFDVRIGQRSVLTYGDASAMSFHATKVFHTAEGGAVVLRDDVLRARVERMRNFGQSSPGVFDELGTNAKLSELHAAVGLAVLAHMTETRARRAAVAARYDAAFGHDSPRLRRPQWHPEATRNYAYYPVLLETEARVLSTAAALAEHRYLARRYFYPALNQLPYLQGSTSCPVAEDAARRALCLPLHASIDDATAGRIARLVLTATGH